MTLTYAEACRDPNLFGPWFEGESWATWRVVDKAIFGEPLDADELATFAELTGCSQPPLAPAREVWMAFGRRAGKDVKAASLSTYLATIGAELYGTRAKLTRGERGVVQLLAVDRDQADVCMNYVKAFFEQPLLKAMLRRPPTASQIELTNNIVIEVTTNDKRRVRGRTCIAVVLDEVAHWRAEASCDADEDVYELIKPSMATIPNALLIGISSPYARRGLFWNKYREHWGKPGRTLFMLAPTWVMNPTLPRDGEMIEDAYATDPSWADAEFGACWRTDIESFVSREAIEACVDWGVHERPYRHDVKYAAFVDPSGGSNDSMTLAIAHAEDEVGVLDVIREVRPPFSPEAVVTEFAAVLKEYKVTSIVGDKYAGEWAREPFRVRGITYDASAAPKSDLYRDALPLINSGKVRLLGVKRLVTQLLNLERRTARSGKDSIDHAPNSHDDVANAAVGAVVQTTVRRPQTFVNGYRVDERGNPIREPSSLSIRTIRLTEQQAIEQGMRLMAPNELPFKPFKRASR